MKKLWLFGFCFVALSGPATAADIGVPAAEPILTPYAAPQPVIMTFTGCYLGLLFCSRRHVFSWPN
jgi:hypothetical protein